MARRAPSSFVASNPHDYMYSAIGLCGGAGSLPRGLAPDYKRPFPLVCEDYARCAVGATGSVAMLNRDDNRLWADYKGLLTEKLPSWVPDLRAAQFPFSVEGEVEASNVSFVGPDAKFLKVRGFDVGEVVGVYFPMQDPVATQWSSLSFDERLGRVHRFLERVARESNTDLQSTVLHFLEKRFLLGSNRQIAASGTLPAPEDLQAAYYHYLQQGTDDNSSSCPEAGGLLDSSAAKVFVGLADSLMFRRAYIVVKGGMYGELVGPYYRGYCEGDRIAVLSGCCHPFILTPVATSEGPGYTLKGSCFLLDGASTKLYTADDFSLDLHQKRTFEDFMLV